MVLFSLSIPAFGGWARPRLTRQRVWIGYYSVVLFDGDRRGCRKALNCSMLSALLELYHQLIAFLFPYTFVAQLPGGTDSLFSSSVGQLNLPFAFYFTLPRKYCLLLTHKFRRYHRAIDGLIIRYL